MSTIGERRRRRDRALFVGRDHELALFGRLLDGELPQRVVHLVGPGGIGKSALLRHASHLAEQRGIRTIWIDGRDVRPFPTDVDGVLADVGQAGRALVVFDSYELIESLDSHLRDQVIPDLPDSTLVVLASRHQPSRGWHEQGWDSVVLTVALAPLDDDEAEALVRAHGVTDPERAAAIVGRSHGSPLALVVGAEAGPAGSGSVVELIGRLLGDEVEPDRQRALSVAAIARVTTPELLADVLGEHDPYESYKWLADRSFAEPLARGVTLHALVAEAVRDQLRSVDPIGEGASRRLIADHLHRRALAGSIAVSLELQHLVVDPAVRWGFASDIGRRYRVDSLRQDDTEQIGSVLEAVGADQWWSLTRRFFDEHPELVGVARDRHGDVGGYFVVVAPGSAPPLAHEDVLLGPWLRHARDELRTTSAVLWRDAVDLTGELGEVTSLLGAGGLLTAGVPNPRYLYLPIAPRIPAALAFAQRLGAVHVERLDVHAFGVDLECHVVDCGPGGLIGNQRDWIYRETGVAPPADVPRAAPTEMLRWLRDPAELAGGPPWLGASPSERTERLRALVTDALRVFGHTGDDELARAIVEAAYLSDNAPHEAIARRLHLSRSAYFRRLQSATDRLGGELGALLQRGP